MESAKSVESREAKKDTGRIGVEKTALVVIDMRRAFLDKGAPLECPDAEALVPEIDEIAAASEPKDPLISVKVLRFREVREMLAHLAG